MNTRAKSFVWGLATQYLFQITMMLLQVVTAPLLLKNSGSEALGAYASIMQFVGYLALLDFGFSSTLSRYLSQAYNDRDGKKRFINYFTIGRWYLMAVYFVMAAVIAAISYKLPGSIGLKGTLKRNASDAMLILAGWYCIRSYFTMFSISLYATQRMKIANLCSTIGIIIRFTLTIVLIKSGWGIVGIVMASVTGDFLTALLQMFFFRTSTKDLHYSWKIQDRSAFKELFSFGMDAFLINISTRIILSSTTFISGIMLGAVAASHYYTMVTPVTLIFTFVNMIMYNLLPGMNEMVAKGELDSLRNTYQKTLRFKLTILVAAFWGLIIFHKFIINIWVGSSQYEGFYYTVILAFYLIVITISSLNENMLIVLGNIKWFSKLQIAATCAGLLLTVGGGYYWGLKGVVLGNFIALTPAAVYVFYRLLKQMNLPFSFTLLPPFKYLFLISILSLVLFFIQARIHGATNFMLLACTTLLFISLIWVTGIDKEYRQMILKIIRKK